MFKGYVSPIHLFNHQHPLDWGSRNVIVRSNLKNEKEETLIKKFTIRIFWGVETSVTLKTTKK